MSWSRLGKALLFPPLIIRVTLIFVSAVLLTLSVIWEESESLLAYLSYVLSAYTLTVWCFRLPRLIRFFKTFKLQNQYAQMWQSNVRLRVNVSLYGSLFWNLAFALFQLSLGLYHRTFWFSSFGVYYLSLGAMRFFLLRHVRRYRPSEKIKIELKKYRACGWLLLLVNLLLSLIVFFMIYWNRSFHHHMITAIVMALYTFVAFVTSIVNVIKYRKYRSPVLSASKAVSFAAACVSMLTLTSTMLTTFRERSLSASDERQMIGGVALAVSGVIVSMAIYMIVQSTKKLKTWKKEVSNGQ